MLFSICTARRAADSELKHLHPSVEADDPNSRRGAKQPGVGEAAPGERQENPVPRGQDTAAHPGQLPSLDYLVVRSSALRTLMQ